MQRSKEAHSENKPEEGSRCLGIIKFLAEDKSHGFIVPLSPQAILTKEGLAQALEAKGFKFYPEKNQLIVYRTHEIVRYEHVTKQDGRDFFRFIKPVLDVFFFEHPVNGHYEAVIAEHKLTAFHFSFKVGFSYGLYRVRIKENFGELIVSEAERNAEVSNKKYDSLFVILGQLVRERNQNADKIRDLNKVINGENQKSYQFLFKNQLKRWNQEEDVNELIADIQLWETLNFPEGIFESVTAEISELTFALWVGGVRKLPDIKLKKNYKVWLEILDQLTEINLLRIVSKLYEEEGAGILKDIVQFLRNLIFSLSTNEEYQSIKDLLSILKEIDERLSASNFEGPASFKIQLWQEQLLEVDNVTLLEHAKSLPPGECESFVLALPEDQKFYLLAGVPELGHLQRIETEKYISKELAVIDSLVFDLETDTTSIRQIAWVRHGEPSLLHEKDDVTAGLKKFTELLKQKDLVVGHNIKKFDLKVLKAIKIDYNPSLIWDTFEIEILLNPVRISYALNGAHNALNDAKVNHKLFRNQICRICSLSHDDYEQVLQFLPPETTHAINKLRENETWTHLALLSNRESESFFRQSATTQSLPKEVEDYFNDRRQTGSTLGIIAPTILWNLLATSCKAHFIHEQHALSYVLDARKIQRILNENPFLKTVLLRSVQTHESQNKIPYSFKLPVSIQILAGAETIKAISRQTKKLPDLQPGEFVVAAPENVRAIKIMSDGDTVFIGEGLVELTSKVLLKDDIDFSFLVDRLQKNPFWVQLSGGKNYLALTPDLCSALGIKTLPEQTRNIWIEKFSRGKFRIWCNVDHNQLIQEGGIVISKKIEWKTTNGFGENTFMVVPSYQAGFKADHKRINPESLYRSLYWLFQAKLIGQLQMSQPIILLINDPHEVTALEGVFRSIGYFVADSGASIARRIELLHKHRHSRKILIFPFESIADVLQANYQQPLSFCWDSFLLLEKQQMIVDNTRLKDAFLGSRNFDEGKIDIEADTDRVANSNLLALHKPLIDFYSGLVQGNHIDNKLFLLDTRLPDYPGIEGYLGIGRVTASMWGSENEYNAERDSFKKFFKEVRVDTKWKLEVEEAKSILEQIFLDASKNHKWRDYQHAYLDEILPAKKSLLITLPTGAGKSVLFQGPALFRANFTNRLSIVISPLKALMEDQVYQLQHKGFLSNVDYLNSDRVLDRKDILRRVAGGEISLLYITPERFRSKPFVNVLLTRIDADDGLEYAIFDEAHCISQWGQEFRPDYLHAGRRVNEIIKQNELNGKLLLFSATVSEQVFNDLKIVFND
jgi:hypothetical protein